MGICKFEFVASVGFRVSTIVYMSLAGWKSKNINLNLNNLNTFEGKEEVGFVDFSWLVTQTKQPLTKI